MTFSKKEEEEKEEEEKEKEEEEEEEEGIFKNLNRQFWFNLSHSAIRFQGLERAWAWFSRQTVGPKSLGRYRRLGFESPERQAFFAPKINFQCRLSFGVRTAPVCNSTHGHQDAH